MPERTGSVLHTREEVQQQARDVPRAQMSDYYREKLAAERLKLVYDIAPPRVRQYLDAEVESMVSRLHAQDIVLDLGCGYGRIFPQLSKQARKIVGIDSSLESLLLALEMHPNDTKYSITQMNAAYLGFRFRCRCQHH